MSIYGLTFSPNTNTVHIATINSGTGAVTPLFDTGLASANVIEWNPDNQKFYISDGAAFYSYDPNTTTTTSLPAFNPPLAAGYSLTSLAYRTSNNTMYIVLSNNQPYIAIGNIDITTSTIDLYTNQEGNWGTSRTCLTIDNMTDTFYMINHLTAGMSTTVRLGTISEPVEFSPISFTQVNIPNPGLPTADSPNGMTFNLDNNNLYAVDQNNYFGTFSTVDATYTQISNSNIDITDMTFASVLCVAGDTLVHMSDGTRRKIRDLKRGDHVKDYQGNDVEVFDNKKSGKSFDFVEIKRGALGPNQPSENTYIRERHPILYKSLETPVELLLEMDIVGERKFDDPVDVFTLVTKSRTFVIMNNIPVCTFEK